MCVCVCVCSLEVAPRPVSLVLMHHRGGGERDFPDAHSTVAYEFESVTRSGRSMGTVTLSAPVDCRCTVLQEALFQSELSPFFTALGL